jgi:hypothetical protein
MLWTMPSARPPCSHFFEIAGGGRDDLVDLAALSSASKGDREAATCRNSTNSPAKLSTKVNRFLISCAIPAVYCPRDVLFSAWIRLGCAASNSRNSVSAVSRAETGRVMPASQRRDAPRPRLI